MIRERFKEKGSKYTRAKKKGRIERKRGRRACEIKIIEF